MPSYLGETLQADLGILLSRARLETRRLHRLFLRRRHLLRVTGGVRGSTRKRGATMTKTEGMVLASYGFMSYRTLEGPFLPT